MTLLVRFNETKVRLFGEVFFNLFGEINCSKGTIELITGLNGNGKTLLLSSLAFLFNYPGFGSVKNIDRQKVDIIVPDKIRRVALVRQNPIDNFAGRYLADEVRLVYAESLFDEKTIQSEIKKLFSNGLDIETEMISRHPRTLSSGEKQMIAICLSLLVKADLILLDEPLARLSKKYSIRVLELLESKASEQYILMTSHKNDAKTLAILRPDIKSKNVVKDQNNIFIKDNEVFDGQTQDSISIETLTSLFINNESYSLEKTWSREFSELPCNNVRCISGSGSSLTKDPLDIEIKLTGNSLTNVRDVNIHQGINLLYGDNGAGKTLIARFLAGEFVINPFLEKFRSIFATGKKPIFDTSFIENMPVIATLDWLRKHVHSFYLPGEPESIIAESTVRREIEGISPQEEVEERLNSLEKLSIYSDMNRSDLSYGQEKIVAFYTLPKKLTLVILDEPFANLSEHFQSEISFLLLNRIKNKDWYSVVITTNRPLDTINALRLGLTSDL